MPILVTGGTGHVGGEVVCQLARMGVRVRAMVRDLSKASAIRMNGVEIVMGDLSQPSSLDAVLIGMNKVLLSSPADPRMAELQINMIDAAKRAGIRHLAKISVMGADMNAPVSIMRWHAQIEQRLAESGVPFTNVRPNFFMQNLLNFAPTISKQGVFYGAMKGGKVSLVDVRDIAAVAVSVLTRETHKGERLTVTGPEALSFGEVAEKLSSATGRKISYVNVAPGDLAKGMRGAGLPAGKAGTPQWLIRDSVAMHHAFSKGLGATVTDVVQRVGMKKPIMFHQFARDYAPVFRGEYSASRFAACL